MKATLRSRLLGEQPVHEPIHSGPAIQPINKDQVQTDITVQFYKSLARKWSRLIPNNWITEEAATRIALGRMPDLRAFCLSLYNSFGKTGKTPSILQAIPILAELDEWTTTDLNAFDQNTSQKLVFIDNEIMKAVLIFWPQSEISSIHGHPKGGCVFKVLKGSIEELRYTTDESPQLLSVSTFQKGGIGYINDEMGYHAVGNPFDSTAVSIHVYTRR